MLRIGKMADYALLITNHLVKKTDELCTSEDLLQATHLPPATVRKLLKKLVDAGIIKSIRGAKGGYRLSSDPRGFTLIDVISAIEGPIALTQCSQADEVCDLANHCDLKRNWSYVNQMVLKLFKQITLADMASNNIESNLRITLDPATIHVKMPVSMGTRLD